MLNVLNSFFADLSCSRAQVTSFRLTTCALLYVLQVADVTLGFLRFFRRPGPARPFLREQRALISVRILLHSFHTVASHRFDPFSLKLLLPDHSLHFYRSLFTANYTRPVKPLSSSQKLSFFLLLFTPHSLFPFLHLRSSSPLSEPICLCFLMFRSARIH